MVIAWKGEKFTLPVYPKLPRIFRISILLEVTKLSLCMFHPNPADQKLP